MPKSGRPGEMSIGAADQPTQSRLPQPDSKLRDLFEHTAVGVYRTTAGGQVLMANPALVRMLGYSSFEDLRDHDLTDESHYEPPYSRSAFIERIERDGQVLSLESAWHRRNGSVFWAIENARAVRDASGKTLFYEGTVEDITERKETEQALRESEERFQNLVAGGFDGIFIHRDHRVLDVNQQMADILGRDRESLLGERSIEWITPESRLRVDDYARSGGGHTYEVDLVRSDGSIVHSEAFGIDCHFQGQEARIVGVRDITARKGAENAVRESEEKFRLMYERSPLGYQSLDADGRFLEVNPAWLEMLGYSREEIIGRWFGDFVTGPSAKLFRERFPCFKAAGETHDVQFDMVCRDRRVVPVEIDGRTEHNADGSFRRTHCIVRDITERKQTEEARERARQFMQTVIDGFPESLLVINRDFTVALANQTSRDMVGGRDPVAARLKCHEVCHKSEVPCGGEAHPCPLRQVIETRAPVTVEHVHEDAEGRKVFVEVIAAPIFDQEGEVVQVIESCRDITARTQAEQAFQDTLHTSDDIVRTIPSGLFIYQFEPPDRLILISGNPEAERLTGIRVEDWKGREFNEIWPEAKHGGITDKYLEVMKTGDTFETEDLHHADERLTGAFRLRAFLLPQDRLAVAFENITERKRAEEELRESKTFLSTLLDAIPSPVFYKDRKGRYLGFNRAFEKFFGATKDQPVGKTVFDIIPPGLAGVYRAKDEELFESGGTQQYEAHVQNTDGVRRDVIFNKAVFTDGQGAVGGQIGAILDITERKMAEEELLKHRERLSLAQDAAGMGMFDWDIVQNQAVCNERYFRLFGLEPQESMLSEEDWLRMVHPDDRERAWNEVHDSLADGVPYDTEYRVVWPDNTVKWVSSKARVFHDGSGNPCRMIGAMTDVTERKEAEVSLRQNEERLRESEGKYRALVEGSLVGIGISKGYQILYANRSLLHMYGYDSLDEFSARPLVDYLTPQSRDALEERRQRREQGEDVPSVFEHDMVRKDGTVRTLRLCTSDITMGETVCQQTAFIDITERKRAEMALREERDKAQQYLDVAGVMFVALDRDGKVALINQKGREILGYQDDEIIGADWFDTCLSQHNREEVRRVFADIMAGQLEPHEHAENLVLHKNGQERRVSWHNTVLRDAQGNIIGTLSSGEDITERKRAEEKLRESEEKFSRVFYDNPNVMMLADVETRTILDVNQAYTHKTGYRAEEMVDVPGGLGRAAIQTDVVETALQTIQETGRLSDYEIAIRTREGKDLNLLVFAEPVEIQGKHLHIMTFIDITERKQTEEMLRNISAGVSAATGEAFFRSLVRYLAKALDADYAFVGGLPDSYDATIRTVAVWAKGELGDDFEYELADTPCENVVGKQVCSYPRDVQARFPDDPLLVEMGAESYVGSPLFDSAGRPLGLAAVLHTKPLENPKLAETMLQIFAVRASAELERRRAEQALQASEERYRRVVEDQTEFVVRCLPDGTRTFVNESYCRYYGQSHDELVGSSFFPLIPEQEHEAIRRKFEVLTPENPALTDEHHVIRPDGSVGWNQWTDRGIFDERGQLVEIQSVGRDVTERKKAEEQLSRNQAQLRSLVSQLTVTEERERKKLAGVLHDDFIQNLALCKMRLDQASAAKTDGTTAGLLGDITDSIRELIAGMRSLTFELCSPILYDIGLEAAIRDWLDHSVKGKYKVEFEYEDDGQARCLAEDTRVFLFRTVRELCTNVIKHAEAQHATVSIQTENGMIRIDVKDDGIGVAASAKRAKGAEGGGLGLFGIRERLDHLGATMEVVSPADGGTCVTLMTPLSSPAQI